MLKTEGNHRALRAKARWRALRAGGSPERGVSDVVATILLLALTVTLFSSVFFFVTSFPSPPPQNSNQFQGSLQLATGGASIASVSILHLGGPAVPNSDTVYLKGATQPTYASFNSPITVASGIGTSAQWNLGQTWTYTFPTPQPVLQNITIYVISPTTLLYSVILPGQAISTPPTLYQAWISPTNPVVGAPFTIYAVFSGTTAGMTPYVNLGAVPGLPSASEPMTAAGPTNEWSYLVTSGLTTTNGTYYILFSGTNSAGQTVSGAVSIALFTSSSGSALSVAVVLSSSPPALGATETVLALVTYSGSLSNVPVTVGFWANQTGPSSSLWSSVGPTGLTVTGQSAGGPSTVTAQSKTQWTIPTTPHSYVVTASATGTGVGTAQGSFTFSLSNLAVTATPTGGIPGSTVTIAGTGFTDGKTVTILWGSTSITSCSKSGSLTVSGTGTFSCGFPVPTGTYGSITITVTDVYSGNQASTTYVVSQTLVVNRAPMQGPTGTSLTVSGSGYTAGSSVTITLGAYTPTGCTSGSLLTSGGGTFTCTFIVPAGAGAGALLINATDGVTGNTGSNTFTQTTPAITGATYNAGAKTEEITGTGWSVNSTVSVFFIGNNGHNYTINTCTAGSKTTTATGTFTCTFSISGDSLGADSYVYVVDSTTTIGVKYDAPT